MWIDDWALGSPYADWTPAGPEGAPRVRMRQFAFPTTAVVRAHSNPRRDVDVAACAARGIPVWTRRGGGGAVVLTPGCIVFTFAGYMRHLLEHARYLRLIGLLWRDALRECAVDGAEVRGHGDLALGDRKLAGTSVFRRRHLLLYQGSLLVHFDPELLDACLPHPSREPEYRRGRSHREFVTSLHREGYGYAPVALAHALEEAASRLLPGSALGSELIHPLEESAWADRAPLGPRPEELIEGGSGGLLHLQHSQGKPHAGGLLSDLPQERDEQGLCPAGQ